jgi:hypothetical protein
VTTPSHFETIGLSITASDPLVKTDRSALSRDLSASKITSYSHELRRVGGYYAATIALADLEEGLNDWIQNGIGRHIEVYNPVLEVVFEGFTDKISLRMGEDTFNIGPLVDIGNRLAVTYSTVDTATNPPTIGARETTATTDNSSSTGKYGIWEKIHSVNGATSTDATQLRDMLVNDPTRAFPATSGDLALGRAGSFNMTLSILGYWHWLKAYYYSNSATGDINLSQKIQDVLAADTNSIFSTDYSKITTNTTQVGDYASGKQTAETILKDLNGRGDSSDNPYSIGFYANRRLVYAAIPTDIKYSKRRNKPIKDKLQGLVRPWDVNPAEWIFRPDFLVGRHPPITAATLGTDPRAGLIETVKYSSPYGLTVNGRKLSQIDQVLAKRGIGGAA